MAVPYRFHPEALAEYGEAADYYLREAPAPVAEKFVAAVEAASKRWWLSPPVGESWRSPRFDVTF